MPTIQKPIRILGIALLVAGFAVAAMFGGRFLLETLDVEEQNRRAAEAFLSRAGTESGTPAAFLTALRVNDHRAYSLTSPHLHYKIDEWLATHERGPLCRWRDTGGEIYTTTGFADRLTVRFQCVTTEGTGYIFEVRGLRIAETPSGAFQIIGWTGITATEVPIFPDR